MDPRVFTLPLDQLPDPLPIPVIPAGRRAFDVTIRPPGSKSLTNRALLLAALADGQSVIRAPLTDADDARVMIRALADLGARIDPGPNELRVTGVGGRWRVPRDGVTLHLENAGTATRFLTAASMLAPPGAGSITIDGNARMRERPIGELVDMLRRLGATVEYAGREGFPPLRVRATPVAGVTELEIGATASSQFVSALLMAAPFLPAGLTLRFTAEPTSRSYIDMTTRLMSQLGLRVEHDTHAPRAIRVPPSPLFRFDYDVEPDASGATYFWAAAALFPGAACLVPGLDEHSLQGDSGFAEVLGNMGAQVTHAAGGARVSGADHLDPLFEDLSLMPDAAMTLAAVCCFTPPATRSVIAGLRTLRVKETDRLAALEKELRKIGMQAGVRPWSAGTTGSGIDDEALCLVTPERGIDCSASAPRIEFDTYRDHRMAMAMALIGLRRPNTLIRDPACVAKTYPTFWRDFATLYRPEA